MRVLVFAAHPDDEVLGPGGTILRHAAAGDAVTISIGGLCRQTGWDTARRVARILGADLRTEEDPERLVRELAPDIVYTHHIGDLNREHRDLYERVLVACRPYAAPSVRSIRTFDTASSTEWGLVPFTPHLFVDVTATFDAKLAAMACYADELRRAPHPRSLDGLASRAAYWGSLSGSLYAEPFVVVRERW